MARLGELLTSTRLIEPEKVEQALRAQVLWGGRLGTNLIELGCIDLEGLSRALGRQHGLPAALGRHFEKADPELQKRLPAELARQWSVVPLLHVGADKKIALAALDPLPAEALVAIADALGVAESTLVVSVAAEMRLRYNLERVYQIARPARFLRAKGKTITPFPQFEEFDVETDAEVIAQSAAPEPVVEKPTGRAAVPPPPVNADDLASLIDEAIANATAVEPDDAPKGRERRTYVKTLGDQVESKLPPVPTITSAFPAVTKPDVDEFEDKPPTLGRLALKRVAISSDGAVSERGPSTLHEAAKGIRRGLSRDRVAELVIEALETFVPGCDAALLLVIRGEVAIGWRAFSRHEAVLTTEVAVPLDQAGLVPRAVMHNMTSRGMTDDLGPIDQALLYSLSEGNNQEHLAICPISIGGQVMCLLAAVMKNDAPSTPLEVIGSAAGAAFTRLVRDASR
ncbi:MAG TPA: hypothetical protein VL326_24215 [Kofleriaceae bacterium]|jgi:hypothetical protein|nr:hypothetical protein [Kofleriaceae bacterium]